MFCGSKFVALNFIFERHWEIIEVFNPPSTSDLVNGCPRKRAIPVRWRTPVDWTTLDLDGASCGNPGMAGVEVVSFVIIWVNGLKVFVLIWVCALWLERNYWLVSWSFNC